MCRRLTSEVARFPDLDLRALDTAGLDDRDAALAHAIYDAVMRRWLSLEWVLGACVDRPLNEVERGVRAVLLAGAAQILLLDRVPDHAAVSESVALAKRLVRPGAGGFVNAVLRRVAGMAAGRRESWTEQPDELPLADGGARVLRGPSLSQDRMERLAIATGHPQFLVGRWTQMFGADAARDLAWHSLAAAPVIVNASHTSGAPPEGLQAHQAPGFLLFRGDRVSLAALLAARADLWVQDPGSAEATAGLAAALPNLRPRLIVDFCAGQGTKTRQLAAIYPEARIIAGDTDGRRLETLREIFRDQARVTIAPPDRIDSLARGAADLILLDVPCSNTGVLARRAEAKYRVGEAALRQLAGLQRRIVEQARTLVAPGGLILYSTCSLEPEENQDQAAWMSGALGWRELHRHVRRPMGRPGGDPAAYTDGSFSVLMAAPAGA